MTNKSNISGFPRYEGEVSKDRTLPRFYTVKEAASLLNVSTKTIRRLLERGLLKSSKALRKKLIPYTDLESFYERTC